jgi:hypothetical protein
MTLPLVRLKSAKIVMEMIEGFGFKQPPIYGLNSVKTFK